MGNVVISLIDDLDLKEILNVTIRFELYQFGSSLEKENFNDIDLYTLHIILSLSQAKVISEVSDISDLHSFIDFR